MEGLTIKDEEIKTEELFLDTKENILVQDGIIQEVQANYEQENDQEMTIEKHEFLEDGRYDCSKSKESDSLSLNGDYAQSSAVCKEIQANYELESHQEITVDKHEFLEDISYDYSNCQQTSSTNLNGVYNYDYSNYQQTGTTNLNGVYNYDYSNCQQTSSTNLNGVYNYDYNKYFEYSSFLNGGYTQYSGVNNTIQSGSREVDYGTYSDKRFRCTECTFSTKYKESLRCHTIALHSKEKLFKCNECEKSFGGNYMLATHIKNVHMKEKSFKCNECKYSCKFEGVLESHIQAMHRKYKQFECALCRFSTNYKNSLKSHMISVHNKARPFKCSDCDYSCAFKRVLTHHVKKYHDKRNI